VEPDEEQGGRYDAETEAKNPNDAYQPVGRLSRVLRNRDSGLELVRDMQPR
jgi:hypothetical protein